LNGAQRRLLIELAALAGFCAFFFFLGLGAFGLVGADEPRYAQVAREMLARNDLVTPTLYGQVWLEKPALYYWRAMFAYRIWGVEDWVARLPSATFATAMIVLVYFHMRRFRPGAELDAALFTASAAGVIAFARGASTDMQLAAPFVIAMLGWYAWYETGRKIWLIDLYFFLAIGTLAKGPVALALGFLIVLAFCLLSRKPKLIAQSLWPPGILIYLAVVLPWYAAVQLRNPQFLRVFIFQHNLERFATNVFHHQQPWWYYLPVILLALVPWTFLAGAALFDALGGAWQRWKDRSRNGRQHGFPVFLLVWIAVTVVLFSIAQSKLPGYILPAVPPFTILLADYLRRRGRPGAGSALFGVHAALAGTLVGLFLLLPYFLLRRLPVPLGARLVAAAIAVAFFAAIYATLRIAGLRMLRFVTLVPVVLLVAFLLRGLGPVIDAVYSARPVASELANMEAAHAPLAVFKAKRETEYGLAFYRNQVVSRYERGEIPAAGHLLVARQATRGEIAALLPGRRISRIGEFPAQDLQYYWISGSPASESER